MKQLSIQQLLSVIPEPTLLLSTDGTILDLNSPATLLFGKTDAEICGESFGAFFTAHSDEVTHYLTRCLSSLKPVTHSVDYFNSEGEKVSMRCRGVGVCSDNSGLTNSVFVCLESKDDLSNQIFFLNKQAEGLSKELCRRKDIEERLQYSKDEVRAILDHAADVIIASNEWGAIYSFNKTAERVFGYSTDGIFGKNLAQLIRPQSQNSDDEFPNIFLDIIDDGIESNEREVLGIKQDGSMFPMRLSVTEIKVGEKRLFIGLAHDLTLQKQEEEKQREQTQLIKEKNRQLEYNAIELEAASKTKSEFLASMSHELRTPLNAIIGFSTGLLERVDRHPLNDHQKDRLGKVVRSGEHLLELICNILDISKIEANRFEVQMADFNVCDLVTEIQDLADVLLEKKPNVNFVLEINDLGSEQSTLNSDVKMLRQILINLVSNAVKFTEEGSITLIVRQEETLFTFRIIDTGIGIPEDQLHNVFGKFNQIRGAIQSSLKGTGLGLSLCQSFTELLGGTLGVMSNYGQGAAFTLSVPSSGVVHTPIIESNASITKLRNKCTEILETKTGPTVLCIEDQPFHMRFLMQILHSENYRIIPAFDGAEGLELARLILPDVITLDVMMPEMDGWEVLKALKRHEATRDIPVIMTTAISAETMAQELGTDSFVVKPVDQTRLLSAVENALQNKQSAGNACEFHEVVITEPS